MHWHLHAGYWSTAAQVSEIDRRTALPAAAASQGSAARLPAIQEEPGEEAADS